ncbi:ABC transporter substrate-binding protein [Streptomyces sp. NPDC001508]|uniref:ABC transporter substrate-binding protein n=1 Tax=Streptomyces sp. NPDC001508 TaxID=3154656 RepID=UPI003327BF2E
MSADSSLSRRTLLAGAGALSLGGLLAACSGNLDGTSSASGTGRDTLDLVMIDSAVYSFMPALLSSFYGPGSATTVKVVQTPGTFDSVDQRVQSDLAAGVHDSLAMIGGYNLSKYVSAQRAVALDGLVASSGFDQAEMVPALMDLCKVDGRLYAMPYSISTLILFYNADAFTKAGLDPDKPPTTFSEVRQYAEQLVASKATKYGATFSNDQSGNFCFQNFLRSNGGAMASADGRTPAFDDDAGVEVLQFWAKLFKDGLGQTMTYQQEADAFGRGDLGMMYTSSAKTAGIAKASKFDVRTAVMPIPDGGTRRCVAGLASLVLLDQDARRQKSAFDVISKLVSPAAITTLVKASGLSSVNRVATDGKQYLRGFFTNPLYRPGNQQLANVVNQFAFPGSQSSQITDELQQEIILALRGSKSCAQALGDAAKQTSLLLEESK